MTHSEQGGRGHAASCLRGSRFSLSATQGAIYAVALASPTTASSHPHPSPWRQGWTSWHRGLISTQRALCLACGGLGGGTDPTKLFENSSVVSLWLSQGQETTQTFLCPVPIATLSVLLHSLGQATQGLEVSPWIVGQGGSGSGPWQGLSIMKLPTEFRAGCQPSLPSKQSWVQS